MGESWTKKMGESMDSGGYRGISKGELKRGGPEGEFWVTGLLGDFWRKSSEESNPFC